MLHKVDTGKFKNHNGKKPSILKKKLKFFVLFRTKKLFSF